MNREVGLSGFEEIEQAFFDDGYRIAANLLSESSTSADLFHAIQQMYVVLDDFIELFLDKAGEEGTPASCKKGCAWCCHQAVFAQAHEFRFLKHWMYGHLVEKELETIRIRAKEKLRNTISLTPEHRLLHKEACPLLVNDSCIAYEARPVACRIYLSKNVESCIDDYKNPQDSSRFPALFDLPLRAGRKMNEGFAARLTETGISTEEYSIEEGLASPLPDRRHPG